eukprot:CAMPEP_0178434470 /NCGR_PEP_ID=MMETSP0689_2-20121128/33440_1 /TAXON_ID=160604 /ORGANISM="Amphidinium massartii, Strain CS-259" /LENGTH=80 /DNA_ID=CAMNT_0020056535 /DNA_START=165 /DNA_END=407 /DNA_ORIENTATION=+
MDTACVDASQHRRPDWDPVRGGQPDRSAAVSPMLMVPRCELLLKQHLDARTVTALLTRARCSPNPLGCCNQIKLKSCAER